MVMVMLFALVVVLGEQGEGCSWRREGVVGVRSSKASMESCAVLDVGWHDGIVADHTPHLTSPVCSFDSGPCADSLSQ